MTRYLVSPINSHRRTEKGLFTVRLNLETNSIESDCLDKLAYQIEPDENAGIFSELVYLVLTGHWDDYLAQHNISPLDRDEEIKDAYCKYLRNIRLNKKTNLFLKPSLNHSNRLP